MRKAKKPKPKDSDPEQSKRFIEAAKELEAAGELNPIEAGERVSRIVASALGKSPKRPQ